MNRRLVGLALGAAGLVAAALALVGARACRDEPTPGRPTPTAARRADALRTPRAPLDVEAFQARERARIRRALELMARRPAQAAPRQPLSTPTLVMVEPRCILGPAELCLSILDLVGDCDAGDGRACLAIGEFLEETPPRPLVVVTFYLGACRAGEPEGCAHLDRIHDKAGRRPTCEEDALACGWRGLIERDERLLACATLVELHGDDPELERTYLQASCQLGNPMACSELGHRLDPGCRPDPDQPCYPPDPEEAAAARQIACEVGFTESC